MRRLLWGSPIVMGIALASAGNALAAPPAASNCTLIEPGKLRCAIAQPSDCDRINDYPYARDLFCAGAYAGVQAMLAEIAKTLKVKAPSEGFFYYYQTLADPLAPPDEQAQTTTACLDTPAPYPGGSKIVTGAGTPLCELVAFVTSTGGDAKRTKADNPIPRDLRTYPEFFAALYAPDKSITKFRAGSPYDDLATGLGAGAEAGFRKSYGKFSPVKLYDPDHWTKEPNYRGISGGGGGGWGGELAVLAPGGPVVQLAFGGGGGGGMSSFQPDPSAAANSKLGAGGGGGVQFADGYRHAGKSYNGLGLGAGMGTGEDAVQYSYNDYAGSTRPAQPVHQYNAPVIDDYVAQIDNLAKQLAGAYKDGTAIVLRGGGGMGAGTEYLAGNGQPFVPNAMSTQGGFQFNYTFARRAAPHGDPAVQALDTLNAQQENVYAIIGDAYQTAVQLAFEECGRDYSNFACMCPREHANVICLVREQIDDPAKIPGWLQVRHCPGDDDLSNRNGNGFTSYQQFLLDSASPLLPACTTTLKGFFSSQNTP
jgi:hypothetical protein